MTAPMTAEEAKRFTARRGIVTRQEMEHRPSTIQRTPQSPSIVFDLAIDIAISGTSVDRADILGRRKTYPIATARLCAMWLCWEAGLHHRIIADMFGRCRTMTLHAVNRMRSDMETYPNLGLAEKRKQIRSET